MTPQSERDRDVHARRFTLYLRIALSCGWLGAIIFALGLWPLLLSSLSCSAAAPACKGAHLANEACDLFMIARPNDAGVEPVSAPELSRFAEEHHKMKLTHIVDAGGQ